MAAHACLLVPLQDRMWKFDHGASFWILPNISKFKTV